ncbi:MAG TPA: thymidine phosphorylase family protein [Micropepsaceae bacterium]|jgi:thymidine phosphorylase|nr:thymidine phosphorylase family protein [Micropepsaceae bacterium]
MNDGHHRQSAIGPIAAAPRFLDARRLGIEAIQEAQIYLHKNCEVCKAEGLESHARVTVSHENRSVIANLYQVTSDMVGEREAGLSDLAWQKLGLHKGGKVTVSHPPPLDSFGRVRGKVYGRPLDEAAMSNIIRDVAAGFYSNVELSAFITACAARALDQAEICALTRAMIQVGDRISWDRMPIVDKHSVGGLPGNRTTPIIVAIVAACGLTIPKTSSRAITSPAGTADTMETLAPVDLDLPAMRSVVEREGGCIVWGGAVRLSPTDDILIRVERLLDLDSEGQLVASIISKKVAAGSTHLVLDMPVGKTAKVRSAEAASVLSQMLVQVGLEFGLTMRVIETDGTQPVGHSIGPALEAFDVLAVLQRKLGAPSDLRQRALLLASQLLELGGVALPGAGAALALETLDSGRAWSKFQRICEAQGGMRVPPIAPYRHTITAARSGRVAAIDNRRLAKLAKLAGAPEDKAAGLELHVRVDTQVERSQPLYTVHAEAAGELDYALEYAQRNRDVILLQSL